MGTIKHRVTRSLIMAIALLGSSAAVAAPATHAAPAPSLTINAEHTTILVNGSNFFNYQGVTLRAYGLANGQKVLLATTQVTSFPTTDHSLVWYFLQAQDPCNGRGGYLLLEVDAYGWPTPVNRSAGAVASLNRSAGAVASRIQLVPVPYMPKITSTTASVFCGVVIF